MASFSRRRLTRKHFKQCALEPVEKELPKTLPGVPIHFNYGIFFDDDYDYMQHLKSTDQSDGMVEYRIVSEPGNEAPAEPSLGPTLRQAEADESTQVVDELDMNSDHECLDDASELEDNFIELAGGCSVHDSEEEESDQEESVHEAEAQPPQICARPDLLSQSKVKLMEKFLYGDNEEDSIFKQTDQAIYASELPDEQHMLDRQFQKLMVQCQKRVNCGQSLLTASSTLSEDLQLLVGRDDVLKRRAKVKLQNNIDPELKNKTVGYIAHLGDVEEESAEEMSDSSVTDEKGMSFVSKRDPSKVMLNYVKLPVSSKRCSETASMRSESMNPPKKELASVGRSRELVRHADETVLEKKARKKTVKEHRRMRRQIKKINQNSFRSELEKRNRTSCIVVNY